MENLIFFLKKTVGQKFVVGLTGLGLILFLMIHVSGNLLILKGPEAYNGYAHRLHEFFLMEFLEIGLFTFFAGHILLAGLLNIKNLKARDSYRVQAKGEKKLSFSHRFLALQGLCLLFFLLWHLLTFKYGPFYEVTYEGQKMRDLYALVLEIFKNPLYVLGYMFCLLVLGLHLIHGLSASFRSLGFYHPRYTPFLEKVSFLVGGLIILGFILQPLYVFFIL